MVIEYKTKKGSTYIEDNNKWYHFKYGRKIELGWGLKVASSVLEDVLEEYNLEKGKVVEENKRQDLISDLNQESKSKSKLGDEEYRIVFLSKNNNMGYSSRLINEGSSLGNIDFEGSGVDLELNKKP